MRTLTLSTAPPPCGLNPKCKPPQTACWHFLESLLFDKLQITSRAFHKTKTTTHALQWIANVFRSENITIINEVDHAENLAFKQTNIYMFLLFFFFN